MQVHLIPTIPFEERHDYDIIIYCDRNLKTKCNKIALKFLMLCEFILILY